MIKRRFMLWAVVPVLFLTAGVSMSRSQTDSSQKTPSTRAERTDGKGEAVNESYWATNCSGESTKRQCNLSLELRMKDSNQQVLLVGLVPDSKGRVTGSFTLPFGLDVSKGISIATDSPEATVALPFKTCLPQGCIVPVRLDETFVKKMQRSKGMKLKATLSGGQPVILDIPLKGFSEKLSQLTKMSKEA